MMDTNAYRGQLQALLPSGAAWTRDPDASLTKLLAAWADSLARVDQRADALIEEADPRTTLELLPDWERVAGLPDPCCGLGTSLQSRRNQLVARLTDNGGQRPIDYINLAAALGYTITVTASFSVFRCGVGMCGYPINGVPWAHAWAVNAPLNTVIQFRAGTSVSGDPLSTFGNVVLECVIRRRNRATKTVIFRYS